MFQVKWLFNEFSSLETVVDEETLVRWFPANVLRKGRLIGFDTLTCPTPEYVVFIRRL